MPDQDCISEHKLDDLLDGYLKALDDLIPKLQKGQKADLKIKYIRHFGSQNSDKEESTNNDMNTELPKSEFDDFILDLINDYLMENPWSKEKKSKKLFKNPQKCYYTDPIAATQNNDKELGIEVDCQKQVEAIKNESKLFEGVKNNVNELAEIEEKTAAKLNMNPTENKYLKTKNNEGLKDNHPKDSGLKSVDKLLS
ncbi:38224_t:CDS:2, partial [Gigaspora margarita]